MKIHTAIAQTPTAGMTSSVAAPQTRVKATGQDVEQGAGQSVDAEREQQASPARRGSGLVLAAAYDEGNGRKPAYGMTAQNQRAVNEYTRNQQQKTRNEITAMLGVDYYA